MPVAVYRGVHTARGRPLFESGRLPSCLPELQGSLAFAKEAAARANASLGVVRTDDVHGLPAPGKLTRSMRLA